MDIKRDHRSVVELTNCTTQPLRVWIEPWAEDLILGSNQTWHVVCDSPRPEPIPIEIHTDCVVVHGLSQSLVRVLCDGELVWECYLPSP
jgi:hypothetical protein